MATKEAPPWKRRLALGVNVALFVIALGVLRHILTEYKFADIVVSLHKIGLGYLGASLALTVLGYASLVGYDYLSLRIAKHPIAIRKMWSASFISHAVQNSAPMSIVAGGGLRYRLFSRLGVTGAETATVVAGNLLTFIIGLFAVAGLSFIIAPVPIPATFHLPIASLQPVGIVFVVLVVAALIYSERGAGTIKIWKLKMQLPKASLLREQLGVSVADWLLSSTALYVLMIAGGPVSYPKFLSGFLLAQIVTQVVPLPGGVGVFEAAILLLRPQGLEAPLATAALLVYRVVYYLIPLFVATAILTLEASKKEKHEATPAVRIARDIAPHLFAVLTFIAGAVLLAFDTIPVGSPHLKWLGHLLELAVLEGSHFIGSLVGVGLLLLAFGLERQLRSAFHFTVGLLLLGIPAAILRSMDVVSAIALTGLLLLLLLARKEFSRTIPFGDEPLNGGWLAAAFAAIIGIGWLGIYLQVKHEYKGSLWWKFALDQDAPRLLRVGVSVMIGVVIFAGARFVSRARSPHHVRGRGSKRGPDAPGKTRKRAAAPR